MLIVVKYMIFIALFSQNPQDKPLSPLWRRWLLFRASRDFSLIFNAILNIRKTAYLEASRAHSKLVVFSMHKLTAIISHHLIPVGFSAV